jgi:hypothetical protein
VIATEELLFNQTSLSDSLRAELANVIREIDRISSDHFLANTDEQIIDFVYSKMEVNPLIIYRDRMMLSEPQEIRVKRQSFYFEELVEVPMIRVELSIPYIGESNLWKMQPSTFTFNPPCGNYWSQRRVDQSGTLKCRMEFTPDEFNNETINTEIEKYINSIEQYIAWIKHDVENHNSQLKNEIVQGVSQRRQRLGKIQKVTKTINIPIQTREGAPSIKPLPLQKKIIRALSTQAPHSTEYTISNDDYEYILKVIHHEGSSFERTPETFLKHDEEELRNILLAHLNGHYNGLANGEAFRKKGKTDISIEFENRAAFVAECKLWEGEKKLSDAVDQLFGYLTWRDCKTSLIIFNKDVAAFSQIQEKVPEILKQHTNFIREENAKNSGEWRMAFRSQEDPDRVIIVHIFLFNLYVNK